MADPRRCKFMVKLALLGAAPVAALFLFAYPRSDGGVTAASPALSRPAPVAWSDPPARTVPVPRAGEATTPALAAAFASPAASDPSASRADARKPAKVRRADARRRIASSARRKGRGSPAPAQVAAVTSAPADAAGPAPAR